MTEIPERIEDYLAMGVPTIWVVDPWRRKAYSATSDGKLNPETETLRVPSTAITVSVAEIFAELDTTSK
jgi:Uma2 family endonuclease